MKLCVFLSFCACMVLGDLKVQKDNTVIFPVTNTTNRQLVDTSRRSVLLIRAYGSSKAPIATESELKKYIFTDSNSLKQQMYKCSAGMVDIYQSSYGVIDVSINVGSTNNLSIDNFVAAVMAKALDYVAGSFADIRQAADHIFIVLPKIFGDYTASGEIVSSKSVGTVSMFQDTYALSLTVLQHEFGHNLGLYHAGWKSDTYGDFTGNMGVSLRNTKQGPLMCYNAANHWQLNWFSERRLDLGAYGPSTQRSITVSAFVDFAGSSAGHYVLVRVGNLYMQYNRAKKHNAGTRAMANQLVIIRENGQSTTLVSGLDVSNPLYKEGNLEIRVCSTKTLGNVDTMEIVIRSGFTSCPKATSSGGSPWGHAPSWDSKTGTGTNNNNFFTSNRNVDFPAVSDKFVNNKNTSNGKKPNADGTTTSSWSLRGAAFNCIKGC